MWHGAQLKTMHMRKPPRSIKFTLLQKYDLARDAGATENVFSFIRASSW